MHRYQLSIDKANILRQRFIDGEYRSYLLAKELRVSTITTWRYKREFERIRAEYPDRLNDFGFYPGEPPRPHWDTPKYRQLALILPALLADEHTPTLETSAIFKKYLSLSSDRYTWRSFKGVFVQWVREHVTPTPRKLLDHISPEDAAVLKKWRSSNDHRHWQIAKSLEMAQQGASRKEIIDKVETIYKTLNQWLAGYKAKGMKVFETAPHVKRKDYIPIIKERKERLLKLIHETPKLYGLNRTSWSVRALTLVYNKLYTPAVSYMQISVASPRWAIGIKRRARC